MAQLYANENFPLPTVEALREFAHDVLTSYEAGRANRKTPDEEVLSFAASEGRALPADGLQSDYGRKQRRGLHNMAAAERLPRFLVGFIDGVEHDFVGDLVEWQQRESRRVFDPVLDIRFPA